MYLMLELILFSPLIAYACIRTWKLLPRPALKYFLAILYGFMLFGYPIAEVFSRRELGDWTRQLVIVSYCGLPYLLYFTLMVVTIDIVIALARIAKILKATTISNIRFRTIRFSCCLVLPALIVFAGALNNNLLQVKEYKIELPQKSSAIKELNIVYASDLHLGQITNDRFLEKFVSRINALHPDIILFGGDIIEGHGNDKLARFEMQLHRLSAKNGVYATPGNHESHNKGASSFYANSGIKLLDDEASNIDNTFYLVGRKDGHGLKKKPIEDLLRTAPNDLPVILLDHSPVDLENVSKSRVDLQLSGHTHNGQLFPVNFLVMPFQYELAWGAKTKRNTQFIVSSGVHAWGPPIKTAGNSEILFIRIAFRAG